MSRRKSEIAKRFREFANYDVPDVYKYCEKCGKPIATVWSHWKYKYCVKCAGKALEKFEEKHGYVSGGLKLKQIKEDYATDGRRWLRDKCEICGFTEVLEVHRVKPGKRGGKYTIDNVITLCPTCHALITRRKRRLMWEDVNNNRTYKLV
jgi:hypothetical protein